MKPVVNIGVLNTYLKRGYRTFILVLLYKLGICGNVKDSYSMIFIALH